MSALVDKHRTVVKDIQTQAFKIINSCTWLYKYPDSDGDRQSIGAACYEITQQLVTLHKIAQTVAEQIQKEKENKSCTKSLKLLR